MIAEMMNTTPVVKNHPDIPNSHQCAQSDAVDGAVVVSGSSDDENSDDAGGDQVVKNTSNTENSAMKRSSEYDGALLSVSARSEDDENDSVSSGDEGVERPYGPQRDSESSNAQYVDQVENFAVSRKIPISHQVIE